LVFKIEKCLLIKRSITCTKGIIYQLVIPQRLDGSLRVNILSVYRKKDLFDVLIVWSHKKAYDATSQGSIVDQPRDPARR